GGHTPGPNANSRLLARVGRKRLVLLRSQILLPEEG
ncbi:MAG: glycosyl transferase, partial [Starkeya sp.]|nr:glycosyl transferase [Starkeya sp.]